MKRLQEIVMDKACPICKKTFHVKPSHNWRVHCSRKCYGISQSKRTGLLHPKWRRIEKICIECGKLFYTHPCNIKIGKGKLCSRGCRASYVGKKLERPGSLYKDTGGYIWVLMKEHPNVALGNKYVKRAVLIAEKKLNRYLIRGEITHHKNGIKNDDRSENIEVMSKKEHNKLHGEIIRGIKQYGV